MRKEEERGKKAGMTNARVVRIGTRPNKSIYVRKGVAGEIKVHEYLRCIDTTSRSLNNTSCTHALSKMCIVITHPHSVPNISGTQKRNIAEKYIYF